MDSHFWYNITCLYSDKPRQIALEVHVDNFFINSLEGCIDFDELNRQIVQETEMDPSYTYLGGIFVPSPNQEVLFQAFHHKESRTGLILRDSNPTKAYEYTADNCMNPPMREFLVSGFVRWANQVDRLYWKTQGNE
jgi:hypothetical protein